MIRRLLKLSNPRQLASRRQRPLRQPPLPLDQRVHAITLRSAALGIRKRFYLYTPPHYTATQHPLPTLYLFRGHEQEWINPQQDSQRNNRTVVDVYEELLRAGAVGPMILVFPGISSADNGVPGLLVNFKQPEVQPKPGVGRGRFQDYFLHELVPYVDAHYRTDPGRRGTDGFSLGGFMATKIAAQYPALFRTAGAYDGLFFWDDPTDGVNIAATDLTFANPIFDPAFGAGPDRDRRYAAANNALNLVRRAEPALLRKVTWLIEYGPESGEPHDSNFYRGHRLCKLLASKGVHNQGRGELASGSHSWWWADEHMRHVLPLHWQALSAQR